MLANNLTKMTELYNAAEAERVRLTSDKDSMTLEISQLREHKEQSVQEMDRLINDGHVREMRMLERMEQAKAYAWEKLQAIKEDAEKESAMEQHRNVIKTESLQADFQREKQALIDQIRVLEREHMTEVWGLGSSFTPEILLGL